MFDRNDIEVPPTAKPENSHNYQNVFRGLRKFAQQNIAILVSLLGILSLCLLVLLMVMLLRQGPVCDNNITLNSNFQGNRDDEESNNSTIDSALLDANGSLTLSGKLKMVSRLEWLATPPVQYGNPLEAPVPYVVILHTATENCSSQAQCILHVRFLQTFHIESRNWWDIGYNFLVGGDGEAYEGRGWKFEGAHTYGYNAKSIGIAFIGTFNDFKPPDKQILAAKRLIEMGVDMGYVKKDYKLLAHRQLQTTQSPGAALYEDMKKWDHWAEAP